MAKFILLLAIIYLAQCIKSKKYEYDPTKFDPTTANYCDPFEICGMDTSTACDCRKHPEREEDGLENYLVFRNTVVHYANFLRNKLASGEEKRPEVKLGSTVSNMIALSYDMEIEYIARCFLRSSFKGRHDPCRMMSRNARNRAMEQGFGGGEIRVLRMDDPKDHLTAWYDEILDMSADDWINYKGSKTSHGKIGHATALLWATSTHMGCARGWYNDPKKLNFVRDTYKHVFLCNFANLGKYYSRAMDLTPNAARHLVVKKGQPCSACPANLKCNSLYPALCGEITVPEDPPYEFNDNPLVYDDTDGKTRLRINKKAVIIVAIWLLM